jgi:XTP/dITP diphosphohydrolase
MNLVLATSNENKLREFREILGDTYKLEPFPTDVEETGETFEDNALLKAREACKQSSQAAIADDSGLCVDALNDAPGVYSARYGREGSGRARVLRELNAAGGTANRAAKFVSAIALCYPDGREFTVRGECEGEIAYEIKGKNGFGYDSIFYLPEFGKTMAEISAEQKNAISHRGKAIRALKELIFNIENEAQTRA